MKRTLTVWLEVSFRASACGSTDALEISKDEYEYDIAGAPSDW